jgi:hypothetical protein
MVWDMEENADSAELIRFRDGTLVQVTLHSAADGLYGMEKAPRQLMTDFPEVARSVRQRIDAVGEELKLASSGPEEVSIEFGLEIESSAGIPVLVRGRANCHIVITATWRRGKP